MDARNEYLDPLVRLIRDGGGIRPLAKQFDEKEGYCPFVERGSVAIAWDGEVSPCVALMRAYTCYVLGREKFIRRYTIGNVGREKITLIWDKDDYRKFRNRVLKFDFAPCIHCGGCEWSESNKEDCFGNSFPVCGDCLWARKIILCP